MTTTLNAPDVATVLLRAGERLTITAAAASTALVERTLAATSLEHASLAASTTLVLGEYLVDQTAQITTLTGSLTYAVSQDTGQVKSRATQTNDDAPAGAIGEILQTTVAVGDAVSETTNTGVDVCTLALTPGDWDVSAVVDRALAGTTATRYAAGVSLTANTMPTQAGGSGLGHDASITQNAAFGATVTGNYATVIPPVRASIAVATTIHLVADDLFSAGTVGLFGTIRARRVR